ncbi:acylneuraminate cytidylyltransferase family protein [Akkermansiaceae bacterium]|nr:acylneuraminate cytidylyltransferase family protein [Akkermansiaceae bacterium]
MKNESHKLVALLPMKAHSSRVSGKNFRVFAGKPLFRWILDTLLEVEEIEKIIINTDARAILRSHGLDDSHRVVIRDRKKEICGDEVSMNSIIQDDLSNVESETYLMTHTTNPLLSCKTIKGAVRAYRKGIAEKKDSLFTVNSVQTRFYRGDASPVNHDPDQLIPTQDLETWYEENSNLYLFSKKSFEENNARIGSSPLLFETPPLESADIDDPTGWTQAEIFALSRQMAAACDFD